MLLTFLKGLFFSLTLPYKVPKRARRVSFAKVFLITSGFQKRGLLF